MFSKPYFNQLVKSNIKTFALFTVILCLLISIILTIFTPETIQEINKSSAALPFNPLGDLSSLLKFISSQYFGMMALILPMIYSIFVGNKLIAGKVDRGDMAYNLSTPITRTQITGTSAAFLIGSLTLMFSLIALTGVVVAQIVQPGELHIDTFLMLTLGAYGLQLVISGIVFCSSCLFNTSNKSLAFGAGIPVFFFIVNLLVNMSSELEFLKALSLFELFDADSIIDGGTYGIKLLMLFVITLVTYVSGIFYFKKKDLPL